MITLEYILKNQNSKLFKDFASYLNQTYCIENLTFWLTVNEYKDIVQDKEICESIINIYIKSNAPEEINIPCYIRQNILDNFENGNYHIDIFEEAVESILELMRMNSFIPWLSTAQTKNYRHSTYVDNSFSLSRSSLTCHSLIDLNSVTRYKSVLKRVKQSILGLKKNKVLYF